MRSRWSVLAFCLTVFVTILCIRSCLPDGERKSLNLLRTVNSGGMVVSYIQINENQYLFKGSVAGVKPL